MIPAAYITEQDNTVGWPTVDQVEQDLVLSRLIIEIANATWPHPLGSWSVGGGT